LTLNIQYTAMSLQMGIGIASALYGGYMSGKANKAQDKIIGEQKESNEAFYNNSVNRNFLDTNAARGVIEQLRKDYENKSKTVDTKAAVTGSTPEAVIAEKAMLNDRQNQVMSNVAQQGTAFQQRNTDLYRMGLSDIYRQRMEREAQKAASGANLTAAGINYAEQALPKTEDVTGILTGKG